jgi:hypothetical protein
MELKLVEKYLGEKKDIDEAKEMENKEILKHLAWIAGAFNTALNTQKQYEVVKANKDTRKKLKAIFALLKKYGALGN